MRTALRPYLTTGIALVGAGVIAVTPVTVPPQNPPAVEIAAPAAVRTVTADVEFTALLDELIVAFQQSVTETIKLYTQTLPTSAADLISAGRFAHLAVLAVNTAYFTPLTIIAPFAVGVIEAIPKPFGGLDGAINEALKVIVQTPAVTGIGILSLFASIIDDGLSPFDAVVGSFGYLTQAVTATIESLQKIANTLAGALPTANLAPPPVQARQGEITDAAETRATETVVANEVSSYERGATQSVTLTVDDDEPGDEQAAPIDDEGAEENSPADEVARDDTTDAQATPNGGTDLSDGNHVEPGDIGEVTAGDDDGDSPVDGEGTDTVEADTTETGSANTDSEATKGPAGDAAGDSADAGADD